MMVVLTDLAGTIAAVSHTMQHATGRSHLETVGSPLTVLQHPDLPAAVIAELTLTLRTEPLACAYIQFADKRGASLWLVTVAIPVAGGMVLLGFPPTQASYLRDIERIYRVAADAERTNLEAGLSRDAATATGADRLDQQLRTLGFAGFKDLMRTVLPAEAAGLYTPVQPNESTALDGVWTACYNLHQLITQQLAAADKLFEISQVMVSAAEDLRDQADPMDQAARQVVKAASTHGAGSATLLTAAHRLSSSAQAVGIQLMALTGAVERTQRLVLDQRLALAGAKTACEVLFDILGRVGPEGVDEANDLTLLAPVAGAVDTLSPALSMGAARVQAALTRLAKDSSELAGQVRGFGSSAASWQLLAGRFGLPAWLLPQDLDPQGAAARLDGIRDLARGTTARPSSTQIGAVSDAVSRLNRSLRWVHGQ
jgi:hypothetical protein